MTVWVKICGLTSREAVQAAVEAGADAIGFVFAESPRQVTPGLAARLCEDLGRDIVRVAVMQHPEPQRWRAVREEFRPDWLQTDAADFATLELGSDCEQLPVFRDSSPLLDEISEQIPSRLLYEGAQSGAGERADWSVAATLAGRTRLVLAGGLSAANVVEALQRVAPWGVDVSSGVERAPGEKDPERISAFIQKVREWERGGLRAGALP